MLKSLEYAVKETKKELKKGKTFLTDSQIKLLNYSLDDDMIGLQDYVFSEEFLDDLEEENIDYKPVHINEKIIKFPSNR